MHLSLKKRTGERDLRILILDNEFPPLGGGTGVVNYHLMEELDRLGGIECDLVTSSRTRNSYEQENLGERSRVFKVPVDNRNIHHSMNIELLRYTVRGFVQAYRLERQQPYDVCLAFAGVPAGGIALALHKLTGLPYIVSLQGPDVPGFEERYATIHWVLRPIIKFIWGHAAVVTAISQEHKRLALHTMPQRCIEIIPNGVDTHIFSPMGLNERGRREQLTVICVGRLIERKGQHHLLEAAALLHRRGYGGRVRIVLVGTGDTEPQLREQCANLNLQDTITFAGFHDRDEMPTFYNEADLFVLPSFSEGMSIALLEAMSAGLPVIVTDTGGTVELLHDNGKIVPWADPAALADAIETFLHKPDLCQKLGERSRSIAVDLSWESFAQAHLNLFYQHRRLSKVNS